MEDCIFCKIAKKEAEATIVYETDQVLVLKDIAPKAPVHLLIIPKRHIPSVDSLQEENRELIGEMFLAAKKAAQDQALAKKGYRLIANVGRDAGQTVDHLHLHLIGGKVLPW